MRASVTPSVIIDPDNGRRGNGNIEDLSIFDFQSTPENRAFLHLDFVAVGLNVSKGEVNEARYRSELLSALCKLT